MKNNHKSRNNNKITKYKYDPLFVRKEWVPFVQEFVSDRQMGLLDKYINDEDLPLLYKDRIRHAIDQYGDKLFKEEATMLIKLCRLKLKED